MKIWLKQIPGKPVCKQETEKAFAPVRHGSIKV